ncbi:MBL fold metallo-hydrolase [Vibrio mimicus]
MYITALVDNNKITNRLDLTVERGLSYHITTMGIQILFDSGSSQVFCENAKLLNVEIENIDIAVISHRHHDHCNGITHFLERNSKALVYLRECEEADYLFKAFGFKFNVGNRKSLFNEQCNRFELINKFTEIYPNVFIITELSEKYVRPKGNKYLFAKKGTFCKSDLFDHELLMVVKEYDGLIIF